MNHFIIIVNDQKETRSKARDIYDNLMSEGVWGFGEHTQNIKKITIGDRLVFYLAGSKGQVFVGTAEVASPPVRTDREEYRSQYWFDLSTIHVWETPRSIKDYLENLEFVKKKEIYGTYLQGGSRYISKADYLTIVSPIFDRMIDNDNEELTEVKEVEADKSLLLKKAQEFIDAGNSHVIVETPHKVRIENRKQKRIVAQLEEYSCQLCGWLLEWENKSGKQVYRIDVDHIVDKAKGGGEELDNLWALCPNCHAKKTVGVITVDREEGKVFEKGKENPLHHDFHLDWS